MSKLLQGAVVAVLTTLAGAGILGLFKLSYAVTRLTVQMEELQRTVGRLERTQTYLHGRVEDK